MQNPQNKIRLIRSLFKGREDVFAIRWEKGNKSGYMPAYHFDPFRLRLHKMKGGSFQNFTEKSLLKLTDEQIQKHLDGSQQIGIYPLLKDNTTWFLAADFDKNNWQSEALTFLDTLQQRNIPAYLERSRSGNGGHVWIFFDQPYPAIRSRKVFISLLEQSGVFSLLDKGSSFDRVFPNQDFLSGKGFGNLIALPFYKPTFENGNSCFVDPNSLQPISDQWSFLKSIQRVNTTHLDQLYDNYISQSQGVSVSDQNIVRGVKDDKLIISLGKRVRINKTGLSSALIQYLKEELNFPNAEFFVKKKSGRSTYQTDRYFKLYEETENEIFAPRGFIGKLLRHCKKLNIDFEFIDERKLKTPTSFSFKATLRSHQLKAIKEVSKKEFGVIEAPPGAGKTILGLKIISERKQNALIIVHRNHLLEQWLDRIEAFLGIPKREIGIVGKGKSRIGSKITVGTIQSLPKHKELLETKFGIIIVDECHHIPAKTFRNIIEKLDTYYLYGLTATPFRKYSDGKMIFMYLGEIITQIHPSEIQEYKHPKIIIRDTELDVPFNSKTDNFEILSKILIHDTGRNKLIFKDIKSELEKSKKVVIITERKEHIDTLYLYLGQLYETITLSGEDSESSQKTKWKLLKEGNFQVLMTTGQYFGEGTDLHNISCLFLVYPFSFKGKLIQYIGRVQRAEVNPIIYDYKDHNIDYLNKLFLKRNSFYRKIDRQRTLFEDQENVIPDKKIVSRIEKNVKVSIDNLDFHHGAVLFKLPIGKKYTELTFQIENSEIRPEFEVLKPYFKKVLKSDKINVKVHVEFENENLVSQSATSLEIDRINKEFVEGIKFQFLKKGLLKKPHHEEDSMLSSEKLQGKIKVFPSEEQLVNEILKSDQYRHSQHIKYLANRHENNIMRIRFVLNPFSFIFLVSGKKGYYIILETLDTDEATYIWFTPKNHSALEEEVKQIDKQLTTIRKNGRQSFLQDSPKNFYRIIHDYSDKDKGFKRWRINLEEII